MFRRPMKPKKNTTQTRICRSMDDNDDEEDDDRGVVPKIERKAKKTRRTVVHENVRAARSSAVEEETLDSIQKPAALASTSEEQIPKQKPWASLYSKDAMAQLKAEQMNFKPIMNQTNDNIPAAPTTRPQPAEEEEEACISLNGTADRTQDTPQILTGEEALLFESNGIPDLDDLMDDGDFIMDSKDVHDWEVEVTRRAGISMPNSNTLSPASTSVSMQHLQTNISNAIEQIRAQQEDVIRSRERRHEQVQQLKEDLRRSRDEFTLTGEAFDYFQKLRQKLVLWIGAMRELQMKVIPIQDALYQLQADVAATERWHDFEDDAVYYLKKQGRLMKVLGRQPAETEALAELPHIDEFGRNIQSQQSLQREKRLQRLTRIAEQRRQTPRGDESDALMSDSEQEEFRERHSALQEALSVGLESLDEHYTKLQWLVDDFAVWKKDYAVEYKQCYASLSLADLASVLVRTELCELNDPWNESEGYNEAKWTTVIHSAQLSGLLDDVAIERLMEKSVLLAIQSLTSKEGLNLGSRREVKALGAFLRHVEPLLPPNSAAGASLRNLFVNYVQAYMARIAIPIPSHLTEEQSGHDSDAGANAENVALHYATIGQLYRIKKVLANVLTWWAPILHADRMFGEFILDFIGSKYLLLLSATRSFDKPRFSASATDMFAEIWNALQPTGWLNDPNLFVTSASVRAAALAFGLS